ncbi:uncharacterized protein F5891DRAFT_1050754 [Suillus fuscotomentosus]|uniref:Uncharacterized protein n=1 Tax=Suillus fuscotomentosus TaxID=1912939 RepID=A0AAD4E054_9AGAM|nr:uncharacterized protein F5891DRAFT_1050754 [Suillus fuscotomentosus]KAG1897172.1 hypothetical protein F5891DRAFT_1050754 [Suillus fuscotomentosus]
MLAQVMLPSVLDPVARNIAILTTTLTAFMVLEYFWFIKEEIRLVWPRFLKTTEAKVYVVIRYAGLAGSSFNIWFAFRMLSGVPNGPFACRAWYWYQTTMTQCLVFSVESLLMLRVNKMYGKGKSIRALLIIFGGAQFAAMAANARVVVIGTRYSPSCVIISPYHSRIYVGVSIIVTFMFILSTMLWRFFGNSSGWSEALRAWLKLAVRDGSCTTIAILVIFIFMFLCNTHVIDTQMSGNIIFYVLLSCLWFAAGRIVLHQAKFHEIQESQKGDINDQSRWTLTIEVDPDDIRPFDDPDACPTGPSGLGVKSTEVSSMPNAGVRDIADKHLCGEDNMQLSSCAPTFIPIEECISGGVSGFRK